MPTIRAIFSSSEVVDVKILQVSRKRNKKTTRIHQLHDTVYKGSRTWEVAIAYHPVGSGRKLLIRVLALNLEKKIIASITVPNRKTPM